MDNSDWDNIKPFLKEMFNFDDDILWTVYFNTQMNLQKTIDILVEISDEQKHMRTFDAISSKMITFDDIKEESSTSKFFKGIKSRINSMVSDNKGDYDKLDDNEEK